jgi:hypothetical protein
MSDEYITKCTLKYVHNLAKIFPGFTVYVISLSGEWFCIKYPMYQYGVMEMKCIIIYWTISPPR